MTTVFLIAYLALGLSALVFGFRPWKGRDHEK